MTTNQREPMNALKLNEKLDETVEELRRLIVARLEEVGAMITSRQIEAVIRVVGSNLGAISLLTNNLVERTELLEAEMDELRSKVLEIESAVDANAVCS